MADSVDVSVVSVSRESINTGGGSTPAALPTRGKAGYWVHWICVPLSRLRNLPSGYAAQPARHCQPARAELLIARPRSGSFDQLDTRAAVPFHLTPRGAMKIEMHSRRWWYRMTTRPSCNGQVRQAGAAGGRGRGGAAGGGRRGLLRCVWIFQRRSPEKCWCPPVTLPGSATFFSMTPVSVI